MQAIADTAALVAAYQRERAGYARRGLPGKVAEVDAQLARLGVAPPPVATAGPMAPTEAPRARRSRKVQEES